MAFYISHRALVGAVLLAAAAPVLAQGACPNQLQPANGIKPSAASGFEWAVVATGLSKPRSLHFDDDNTLWVLERDKGVTKHALSDNGGVCVGLKDSQTVVDDPNLNHGMIVDGNRLIVSSIESVYQVMLDPGRAAVVPNTNQTLINNMTGTDHVTRTLMLAAGSNNSLVVSRGSFANVDPEAGRPGTGHSTIKMFDISNATAPPRNYDSEGTLLGWGLRNDVGLVQHPATKGLYTVENSVDQLQRDGVDVHADNPGEEMNYLGVLDAANMTSFAAKNYGYPNCFSAWKVDALPANASLSVGSPFTTDSKNDSTCANTEPARLTFPAHNAPIDIVFDGAATQAWVSFHGSWNRDQPSGYAVASIDFNENGEPVEPPTSDKAANYIFTNTDNSVCPDACFRPTGLSFDKQGRLFIASDESGEIYVLVKSPNTH